MLKLEPPSLWRTTSKKVWSAMLHLQFYCIVRAQLQKGQKAMMDAGFKRTLHRSLNSETWWLDETTRQTSQDADSFFCTDGIGGWERYSIFFSFFPLVRRHYFITIPPPYLTTPLPPHCLLTTSSLPRHYLYIVFINISGVYKHPFLQCCNCSRFEFTAVV